MNNKIVLSTFVLTTLCLAVDPPKTMPPLASANVPATVAVPATGVPAASVPAYKAYDYVGDRFRDPFVPLIGDGRTSDTNSDIPPPIASLLLKGIVEDAQGRVALLVSGASSYVMRGGRLYDGRNRMVKKISGVVKADSVVVIGADRTVRELRTTQKF